MLIDSLCLCGHEGPRQLRVVDDRIAALVSMEQAADGADEHLNGVGSLTVPPFIELHIHLDIIQAVGQPKWNHFGTLFEGAER